MSTFQHLWDNGLVRALLGGFVICWTFGQSAFGAPVPPEQWVVTTGVSAFFFGTAAVRAGKGGEPPAVEGGE